jgi:F420-dependent oxidoreductase-like protein
MAMRVSLNITDYSWAQGLGGLTEIAQTADEAGIDTLWVSDHLLQAAPGSAEDSPMLEAYTTLGYLAARTERVRLGTMVSAVSYRAPALLIKAVSTLDALSGGRAWLGIGAGYHSQEAAAFGLELPKSRYALLEETLQLAQRMFAGDASPFAGEHIRAERPLNVPHSRVPILVGGAGERRTLRLVAQYADACNVFDTPDVAHKLDVLRRHCDDVGRDYDEITKTISTRAVDEERFAALGIDHAVLITAGPWTALP